MRSQRPLIVLTRIVLFFPYTLERLTGSKASQTPLAKKKEKIEEIFLDGAAVTKVFITSGTKRRLSPS
jgi:hypothetical protein